MNANRLVFLDLVGDDQTYNHDSANQDRNHPLITHLSPPKPFLSDAKAPSITVHPSKTEAIILDEKDTGHILVVQKKKSRGRPDSLDGVLPEKTDGRWGFLWKRMLFCGSIWKMGIVFFVYCQRVNFIFAFSVPTLDN
jgi:hypothetical protein